MTSHTPASAFGCWGSRGIQARATRPAEPPQPDGPRPRPSSDPRTHAARPAWQGRPFLGARRFKVSASRRCPRPADRSTSRARAQDGTADRNRCIRIEQGNQLSRRSGVRPSSRGSLDRKCADGDIMNSLEAVVNQLLRVAGCRFQLAGHGTGQRPRIVRHAFGRAREAGDACRYSSQMIGQDRAKPDRVGSWTSRATTRAACRARSAAALHVAATARPHVLDFVPSA